MAGQGTSLEHPIIAECVAFYRRARAGLKAVEDDLKQHSTTFEELSPMFRTELERYRTNVGELHKGMIRLFNDQFRMAAQDWQMLISLGVRSRGDEFVANAKAAARAFTVFTPDGDPSSEHTSGMLFVDDVRVVFKVECTLHQGSSDPTDPDFTSRVLAILLFEEC